jgi:hypothetical protein
MLLARHRLFLMQAKAGWPLHSIDGEASHSGSPRLHFSLSFSMKIHEPWTE